LPEAGRHVVHDDCRPPLISSAPIGNAAFAGLLAQVLVFIVRKVRSQADAFLGTNHFGERA
jgi:hypothetical protein